MVDFNCMNKENLRVWHNRFTLAINKANGIEKADVNEGGRLIGQTVSGNSVRSGWLKKHATTGNGIPKNKWFILTEESLMYCDNEGQPVKRQWFLKGATANKGLYADVGKEFRLEFISGGEKVTLTCGDYETLIFWIKDINTCIGYANGDIKKNTEDKSKDDVQIIAVDKNAKSGDLIKATLSVSPPSTAKPGDTFRLTYYTKTSVDIAPTDNNQPTDTNSGTNERFPSINNTAMDSNISAAVPEDPNSAPSHVLNDINEKVREETINAADRNEEFTYKDIRVRVCRAMRMNSLNTSSWKSWFKRNIQKAMDDYDKGNVEIKKKQESTASNSTKVNEPELDTSTLGGWLEANLFGKWKSHLLDLGVEEVDDLKMVTSADVIEMGMSPIQAGRFVRAVKKL